MVRQSVNSTNQDHVNMSTVITAKKTFAALGAAFNQRKQMAREIHGESFEAGFYAIEYLDIPTFMRRGVALSG